MHRFEIVIDGAAVCVEADTWRRDLDADVVTFVERYREATRPGRAQEREVLRIRLDHPHRRIRRL